MKSGRDELWFFFDAGAHSYATATIASCLGEQSPSFNATSSHETNVEAKGWLS